MRRHVMKAMSLRSPRHFGRNRRGASAIEFALIAPLMLGLYIGCVEISEGVADRKVTLTAGTLANLTSQVTTLTDRRHRQYSERFNRDHEHLYRVGCGQDLLPENRCHRHSASDMG
ncbi:MAG: TadE/TadG family type IV pilus assembly protein [Pseudolabrys sp.]